MISFLCVMFFKGHKALYIMWPSKAFLVRNLDITNSANSDLPFLNFDQSEKNVFLRIVNS